MNSMYTGTPIDLDAPMGREEYERVLNRILEAGRRLAQEHGWCSEWLNTLTALSPDFTRYPWTDEFEGDTDDVPTREYGGYAITNPAEPVHPREMFTDAGWENYLTTLGQAYTQRLKDIRGRLLTVVRDNPDDSGVTLSEMNDIFTYVGFPPYEYTPPEIRWHVEVGDLWFRLPSGINATQRFRTAFWAFVAALGADVTDDAGDAVDVSSIDVEDDTPDEDDDAMPAAADCVPFYCP